MGPKSELKTDTIKSDVRHDRRNGFRGTAPPASFSLSQLPDDALLTQFQVSAVLQISIAAIEAWRLRRRDHPLKWLTLPSGSIRYTAGALRSYLALGDCRQKARAARAAKRRALRAELEGAAE